MYTHEAQQSQSAYYFRRITLRHVALGWRRAAVYSIYIGVARELSRVRRCTLHTEHADYTRFISFREACSSAAILYTRGNFDAKLR